MAFTSPYIEQLIERVALNAKLSPPSQGGEAGQKMLAISYASHIRLWGIAEDGSKNDIGESLHTVLFAKSFSGCSFSYMLHR